MRKALAGLLLTAALLCALVWWQFQQALPGPDVTRLNNAAVGALARENPTEGAQHLTRVLDEILRDVDAARHRHNRRVQVVVLLAVTALAVLGTAYLWYGERCIFAPFHRLQGFAQRVAAGDLDIPLEMDRHNRFGAFTESFDLMRDELRAARENERRANQSKKELVATLSHDIKTPVASIQAITELMLAKGADAQTAKQLATINAKAAQINQLINDLFHATLEELQALPVDPAAIASTTLPTLLHRADHQQQLRPFTIPDCLVWADTARLQQVFDNIVNNTYKYANTPLNIQTTFDDGYLVLTLMDYGPGVPDVELSLLTDKFFRSQNAATQSGYGLGLHIAANMMDKMHGRLTCENHTSGFAVKLELRII